MPRTMLIVLLLMQIGCTHDVSDNEPFCSVVGKDVVLLRPMSSNRFRDSGKLTYSLMEVEQYNHGILHPGTSLHVTCVKEKTFLMPMVMAYGTGIDPDTGESFNWSYFWGYPQRELRRAPWEDPSTVPDIRPLAQ